MTNEVFSMDDLTDHIRFCHRDACQLDDATGISLKEGGKKG